MDLVLQDVEKALASGAEGIFLIDEEPFADPRRLRAFVEGIEQRGLSFTWFTNARASDLREDRITPELVKRLKRSGCQFLGIGAESGSERILKKLDKRITSQDTLNAARLLGQADMRGNFSFMVGLPGETREDMLKTFRLIEEIKTIDSRHNILGPQVYRPYPGSLLFTECAALGLKPPTTLREWATSGYINDYIVDRITPENYHRYPWIGVSRRFITGFFEQLDNFYFCLRAQDLGAHSALVRGLMKRAALARRRRHYYKLPLEIRLYELMNKTRLSKYLGECTG